MKQASVRQRVAIYVMLACLLILVLDAWRSWDARVERERENLQASAAEARIAAQQIQDALQITGTILHEIARQVAVHGTASETLVEITEGMKLDADAIPQITDILIIDAHGNPLASSLHKEQFSDNHADRIYFQWLRNHPKAGMYITPPVLGHNTKRWLIPVAIRINNPDGSFGGVVVAGLDLDYQNEFFENMNLGANAVVSVFLDDGTLMMRWPFQEKVLGVNVTHTVSLTVPGHEASLVMRSPIDHVERFYGVRRLKHYPLLVAVGLSTHTVFAPWYRDAVLHAIAGILLVIAMSVFGARLLRQIAMRTRAEEDLFRANEALQQIAMHDSLTGLPNRAQINREMSRILADAHRNSAQCAFLFIDLDRFKRLNDTQGHAAGDEALREIAHRLGRCIRGGDVVGRLGGDEFLALLPNCNAQRAAQVADRMLQAIDEPITLSANCEAGITLSASIGIALYPRDGIVGDVLLRNADIAMYRAKSLRQNQAHFFAPEYEREVREHLELETALRRALRTEALSVVYQPKVDVEGVVHGAEALLRWHDEKLGYVPPDRFIAVAEDSGLIAELDAWVLNESCRQLFEWRAAGMDLRGISINVCAADFKRADYPDFIAQILHSHGLNASDLTLEMTERVMFDESTDDIRLTLDKLDQLGVALSIDDFGTGYSSLSYLHRFPVTELKIDRSFVRAIGVDETAESLAQTVVNIGNVLKLKVVAEGVETQAQRDFLLRHGCLIYQGYLYTAPLRPAEFVQWRMDHSRRASAPTIVEGSAV
jgi:diguanylate cyclase (GGDEF)-like protein